ncbi:hypothetical protein AMECASPLE_029537 [Ameca splendens]|uniref:Uncharacterized protein n=1 Tax=Ameca splendens TaxID=208324 RepID=A0ABV0ZGG2_9TELE
MGKFLFVYLKHFKDVFLSNLCQYEGFAKRLHLIKSSVPSVCGNDGQSKVINVSMVSDHKNGRVEWNTL